MENQLIKIKCNLRDKCNSIRFLEKRLKEMPLEKFKKEHCESEEYKKCLYYRVEIVLNQKNKGRY